MDNDKTNGFTACPLGYEAFIFDLDGVLVDSEPLHAETWVEVFTRHGVAMTTREFARFVGITSPQMMDIMAQEGRLAPDIDSQALIVERRDLYMDRIGRGLDEIPGAERLLRALAPRAAVAMATSNLRETMDRILEVMDWQALFCATVGLNDVERAKPAPDIYHRTLERLELPASACLVFEDSLPGIEAARAAGLDVVGVATGHDAATLKAHGAAAVLSDFSDRDAVRAVLARRF